MPESRETPGKESWSEKSGVPVCAGSGRSEKVSSVFVKKTYFQRVKFYGDWLSLTEFYDTLCLGCRHDGPQTDAPRPYKTPNRVPGEYAGVGFPSVSKGPHFYHGRG